MNNNTNIHSAAEWLARLSNLNAATTAERGRAPHKPLLLLCVIDMVEEGVITTPWISYTPELFFRFQCYWAIVFERQRNKPDMRMPFHALGGARIEYGCATQRMESPQNLKKQPDFAASMIHSGTACKTISSDMRHDFVSLRRILPQLNRLPFVQGFDCLSHLQLR